MFGTDRMIAALNEEPEAPPEKILQNVRRAVDGFVKDAEQFDDLTMLCMEYRGKPSDRQICRPTAVSRGGTIREKMSG